MEENKGKDEPAPNRFSAVIEKIERLYMVCYIASTTLKLFY